MPSDALLGYPKTCAVTIATTIVLWLTPVADNSVSAQTRDDTAVNSINLGARGITPESAPAPDQAASAHFSYK